MRVDQVPGLDGAAPAGNPDWDSLLDRPRPDIDVAQFVVLAVEDEGLGFAPGAQDQLARLLEALAHLNGTHPVGEHRIHRRAEYKPRGPPPARPAIEIGILL